MPPAANGMAEGSISCGPPPPLPIIICIICIMAIIGLACPMPGIPGCGIMAGAAIGGVAASDEVEVDEAGFFFAMVSLPKVNSRHAMPSITSTHRV